MQSFVSSICCLLLLTTGYCWAQKGGLPAGQYGLANQNKSPARQIQSSAAGGRPSPFASSGPSTSALNSPTPLSSPALSQQQQQQQEQEAPEPISQQFDDVNSAAVLANTRGRDGGAGGGGFGSGSISGFSSGGGGGGGGDDSGEGHPAPEPYSFSYSVNDEENGSEVSREESQDAAGNIVGFYHIRDNEGRMRRVDYTAGPEGFRATIRSNEEGLANKDSADAKYEVDEVPADRQNQAAAAAASRAQASRGSPATSGGGSTGGSISSFAPSSGSAIGSGGATSLAASFGEDQSAYALAAGQRRKPLTSGPIGQIQQEENLQDDFDDGQSPPPQTLQRIPPSPQQPVVARPQPALKRPSAGIQRPQSQPISSAILPKQPSAVRPSPSFPAKRPLSAPQSPQQYQSPSRSQQPLQPSSSRPLQSKGFAAKPFQAHEQQMFEQQKNEEVPSRSFSSPPPSSSSPSLASYSSNIRPMPGSFGGQRQQQPRLEQQRQPIPTPQMFQYEDQQQQQQELMQQQQAQDDDDDEEDEDDGSSLERMQQKQRVKLAPNDEKLLEKRGFKIGDPINSGSFACVCKATYKGENIAAKIIDLEKTSDDYRLKFLPREIYTMKKLKHKYLIDILDIMVIGNRVIVFMELAEGGDFLDMLRETKALPEAQARFYYVQFGDALRYMHSLGFAHRDIKCENILLNKDKTVTKLTDFGFARSCFERTSGQRMLSDTYCGSAAYVAPEVLQSKPYNPLISDVWSMGVVLYVLVNNRLPFSDRDTRKLLRSQLERNYRISRSLSTALIDLLHQHMNPNPSTRITMNEVLHHEWFDPVKTELSELDPDTSKSQKKPEQKKEKSKSRSRSKSQK